MNDSQKNFDSIYRVNSPKIDIRNGLGTVHLSPPPPQPTRKRRILKTILWIAGIFLVVAATFLAIRAAGLSNKVFVGEKSGFFKQIVDIIRGGTGNLEVIGEKEGQINVLLLGIGGQGHDGPYLSDTMMLAQIKPEEKRISLTSIPRDYLVTLPGYGDRKINAAFAEGYYKNKNWDEGGKLARETVENISGLNIPYFAVVDFNAFEKAIDQVGGVDIEIERTFTDAQYPDENKGYLPPVTFKAGSEKMNGKRALIFARSRHGNNGEGSDFARSQRQHKIIQATKDKVTALNLISDVSTVNNLVGVFADHFHTNLSAGEILHLYTITKDFPKDDIATVSLDPSTGLVCSDTVESTGAYVVVPCYGKTKQDIKDFFANSFLIGRLRAEKAVVWVATENTTGRAYKQTERKLSGFGTTVWPLSYSEVVPEESVIYSVNSKPGTFEYLKNILGAREVTVPPPGLKIDATRSDIIVILGSNVKLDPVAPPAKPPAVQTPPPPPALLTPTPPPSGNETGTPPPPKKLTPPPPSLDEINEPNL